MCKIGEHYDKDNNVCYMDCTYKWDNWRECDPITNTKTRFTILSNDNEYNNRCPQQNETVSCEIKPEQRKIQRLRNPGDMCNNDNQCLYGKCNNNICNNLEENTLLNFINLLRNIFSRMGTSNFY